LIALADTINWGIFDESFEKHQETFELFTQVTNQKMKDTNKVYILHSLNYQKLMMIT